jgi:hypothetical protein
MVFPGTHERSQFMKSRLIDCPRPSIAWTRLAQIPQSAGHGWSDGTLLTKAAEMALISSPVPKSVEGHLGVVSELLQDRMRRAVEAPRTAAAAVTNSLNSAGD